MDYIKSIKLMALTLSLGLLSQPTIANDTKTTADAKPSFEQYIVKIKQEALAKGFEQALIDTSFANVVFDEGEKPNNDISTTVLFVIESGLSIM